MLSSTALIAPRATRTWPRGSKRARITRPRCRRSRNNPEKRWVRGERSRACRLCGPMGHKSDTVDARLGEIAARQHGVVSLKQLEELGLSRYAVAKRAKKGRLHRVHQGVYAVGHRALSWHGRWMAAVLACGESAVLSHGSAASLWGLLKPIEGPTHVSTPSTSGRSRRRGIHLHRAPSLRAPSLAEPSPSPSYLPGRGGRRGRPLSTYRDNIPVTTVARTIEDLRGSSSSHRT